MCSVVSGSNVAYGYIGAPPFLFFFFSLFSFFFLFLFLLILLLLLLLLLDFFAFSVRKISATERLFINTLRTGSFKLFKRPFPGFLTILTL